MTETLIGSDTAGTLMARDQENLERTALDGRPRRRVYRFTFPSVTAGRNSRVTEAMRAAWLEAGHDFARRPTGGGILRHGDDLCFGVTFPLPPSALAAAGFATVARAVSGALARQGIDAVPAASGVRPPEFCFSAAVGAELTWRGEKILGLASRRIRGALLVQGTLAVRRDPERDRIVLGAGPRVDLAGTGFDPERFARDFLAELPGAV